MVPVVYLGNTARFRYAAMQGDTLAKTPDNIDAHVGARVRLRRMTLGMSQEQLASSLGLTFQQVQKYERGMNRIGASRLYHIGLALGVPVAFFYEGLPETGTDDDGVATADMERMMGFLLSPEGFALSSAFTRIEDQGTRRRLVDLVKALGGVQDGGSA